ncbi:MAG TPA: hypothetical protein VM143_02555 [Acidimicrobiales bacterium]|nr:hypothetical protein [Acidimicrobiales bacterium]
MPRMQTAVSAMNVAFGAEQVGELSPEPFGPVDGASTLSKAFIASNVDLDEVTAAFVDQWPSALQAAVRATIFENLSREGRVPITFAWAPGYDYEVTVWDVRDTSETVGGITLLFKSRYPDDPHPLSREAASAS